MCVQGLGNTRIWLAETDRDTVIIETVRNTARGEVRCPICTRGFSSDVEIVEGPCGGRDQSQAP
jgi:hypothetical protein